MIKFKCSECGKSLKVNGRAAGKKGACPACKSPIFVPKRTGRKSPINAAAPAANAGEGAERSKSSESPGNMSGDKLSKVLDIGDELQPDRPEVTNISSIRAFCGVVALVGFPVMILNLEVFQHLQTLFAPHFYESAGEFSEALEPFGLTGVLFRVVIVFAAMLMTAGGLAGVLAGNFFARKTMMAGVALLALTQIAHAAAGFIDFFAPYTGTRGKAVVPLAIFLVAVCAVLFFFLKKTQPVFEDPETDDFANITELVDRVLEKAYGYRASDVHIEPSRAGTVVRFRVDGILHTAVTYPTHAIERIVSRIKVMAGMDIAERHKPQDGGTSVVINGKMVDLRVSTVPSKLGERAVIRILDQENELLNLKSLGMDDDMLAHMQSIVAQPHGMFFCTGPTGSGQTTTLYAALLHINRGERNVMTVEDPVEYHLPGIAQLPISKRKGMGFADGMRSILRQDPDVIMVGAIRDREPARVAVEAAQTGHLVLSTLHTNDSAGAVSRLLDLQVEPYLLASARTSVLAQRLVRRICPGCREKYFPSAEDIKSIGLSPDRMKKELYRGRGCSTCMNTGYRGRVGIYEILFVDDTIREMITKRNDAGSIRKAAEKLGMTSLRHDGIKKAMAGVTTIEEIRRVTQDINYADLF